jgi:hypothetical protein
MFLQNIKRAASKSQSFNKLSNSVLQQRMSQMTFKTSNGLNKPAGVASSYHD